MRTINLGTGVKHIENCKRRRRFTVKGFLCMASLVVPLISPAVVNAQCETFAGIMTAYSRARQASGTKKVKKGTAKQQKKSVTSKQEPKVVVDAPDVAILKANATKIDEFGKVAGCDMMARLDSFAIQLQQEPSATGYIATYSVPTDGRNFGRELATRAKDYLVNTRGMEASRIVTIDGGQRNNLTTQLWISR